MMMTAYRGLSAGAKLAYHAVVDLSPKTCAEPVLEAMGMSSRGKPSNGIRPVPSKVTPESEARKNSKVPSGAWTSPRTTGWNCRTTSPPLVTMAFATCGW